VDILGAKYEWRTGTRDGSKFWGNSKTQKTRFMKSVLYSTVTHIAHKVRTYLAHELLRTEPRWCPPP